MRGGTLPCLRRLQRAIQPRDFMRAAFIVGFVLVILGVASLVYSLSPVLLLVHAAEQRQTNLVLPILGGVALICGIALLFATRPRS
jgi:formate-dependent nitrite reductase membrane component NrfD